MKKSILIISAIILFLNINLFAKDPGDVIQNFSVKDINGKENSLTDYAKDGYLVVMFWSAECPFVQPFNDRINNYISDYKSRGVSFLAFNSNVTESNERVKEHYATNNYAFPMVKDENSKVADIFEATRTPEVFVLDRNLKIVYHGRIEDNSYADKATTKDLRDALEELLSGKEVSNKSTKFFGCSIKRNS